MDRPTRAAHQLGLGRRRALIMHPPDRPGPLVVGDVALDDAGVEAVGGELIGAEAAGEEPPLVLEALEVDDDDPGDGSVCELHQSNASCARRNCTSRAPSSTSTSSRLMGSSWRTGRTT